MTPDLSLLNGYPEDVLNQVRQLIEQGKLSAYLNRKYPEKHNVITDRALYDYINDLKKTHMRRAAPIQKALFDDRLESAKNALGLHNFSSRTHGRRLKARSEIRIASVFKKAPADFLHMISVHELAHLKEKEHNRDFYRLCNHMCPDYHQIEFDVRLYLVLLQIK